MTSFVVRRDLAVVELAGADRQRFLNGLVTCEVKTLAVGGSVYGYVTTGQGRILADVRVAALADRLLLVLSARAVATVASHLAKYVIVDRVEIVARPDLAAVSLLGDDREAVLTTVSGSHGAQALSGDIAGLPGSLLLVPTASLDAVMGALTAAGAVALTEEALTALRVQLGVPQFGVDFGAGTGEGDEPEHFPQEVGVTDAVSYQKGCYLGQEVVARIHYRGGVNRGLCGLAIDADAPPATGTVVALDGRAVGRLGSTARSAAGALRGLAVLHRRAHAAGTRVALADGSAATVATLPFVD